MNDNSFSAILKLLSSSMSVTRLLCINFCF
jgi:hypothetical protein